MQHMVEAGELARAFDRLDVQRFFDHTDQPGVPLGCCTDGAGVLVGDVETDAAKECPLFELFQGAGQSECHGFVVAQQIVGQPCRCFGADPRELGKGVDQLGDRLGKWLHGGFPVSREAGTAGVSSKKGLAAGQDRR